MIISNFATIDTPLDLLFIFILQLILYKGGRGYAFSNYNVYLILEVFKLVLVNLATGKLEGTNNK